MRGDRAFCTGLDREGIGSFDDLPPGKLPGYNTPWDFDDPGKSVCPKSNDLWKPIIAAVNGMACGGAFYILGEVDFIIAAEHATFFDPHVTYGMPAAFEPIFLLHKMPFQEVMRLSLLGANERMSAARAHQIGFVSEVVPSDELRERTDWAAQAIAEQPELGVQGTVRALWTGLELSRRQALDQAYLFTNIGTDPDPAGRGTGALHLRQTDRLAAPLTLRFTRRPIPPAHPGAGAARRRSSWSRCTARSPRSRSDGRCRWPCTRRRERRPRTRSHR